MADEIQLAGNPPWACAWIGSKVVRDIGLFCEAYHPAYFEDNDYERRAKHAGKKIWLVADEVIEHVNSATLQADETFKGKNVSSFTANNELNKMRNASFDEGHWDLQRRIDLSWD
jgi:GT2 family glycosyltransferase